MLRVEPRTVEHSDPRQETREARECWQALTRISLTSGIRASISKLLSWSRCPYALPEKAPVKYSGVAATEQPMHAAMSAVAYSRKLLRFRQREEALVQY